MVTSVPLGDVDVLGTVVRSGQQPAPEATTTLDFLDIRKYSDSQPRDPSGRWTGGGAGVDSGAKGTPTRTIADRTLSEGGSTSDSRSGAAVTHGNAVSVNPELSRVYTGAVGRMNGPALAAATARYAKDNHALLTDGKHSIGTWVDGKDIWFDVVTVVPSAAEADTLARHANQKAYFNLDTGQEVNTGGTGLIKRFVRTGLDFLGLGRRQLAFDPLGVAGGVGQEDAGVQHRRGDGLGRVWPEGRSGTAGADRGRADRGSLSLPHGLSAEGPEVPVPPAPSATRARTVTVMLSPRQQKIMQALLKHEGAQASASAPTDQE